MRSSAIQPLAPSCLRHGQRVARVTRVTRNGHETVYRDGDREGFRRDLEWVAAQDPAALQGPYAWNVYFQRDARQMLADMDRILPP